MKLNVDFTELHKAVSKMTPPKDVCVADAFEAGKDSTVNGQTPDNCHYSYFETPELKSAWEQGKAVKN